MSQSSSQPSTESAKPFPLKWAIGAGAVLGLVISMFSAPPAGNTFDPSTIVGVEQFDELGRSYRGVGFALLAGFDVAGPSSSLTPTSGFESTRIPDEVMRLSGQKVSLEGFMLPLDANPSGVSQFLLNASYDMCYFGAPTRPNDFVVVRMREARRTQFVHTPVVVFGTLTVREERRDGRVVSLYHMEADGIGHGR